MVSALRAELSSAHQILDYGRHIKTLFFSACEDFLPYAISPEELNSDLIVELSTGTSNQDSLL